MKYINNLKDEKFIKLRVSGNHDRKGMVKQLTSW
jgi:hypothetical protein